MNLSGVYINILIGKPVPKPISLALSQLLKHVEVICTDEGPSGFQMVFDSSMGDSSLAAATLLTSKELQPFTRVVISSIFKATPAVIFDGFITEQHLSGGSPETPTEITITGEDASVLMDLEETITNHPAQDEAMIVAKLIGKYAKYGLIPKVKRPSTASAPLPQVRVPVQIGTDYQYIKRLGDKFGYVFYIDPGPTPLIASAYWGPPNLKGSPQKAITVNMGSFDNASDVSFTYSGLKATTALGYLQDGKTNQFKTVDIKKSTLPSLAKKSASSLQGSLIRQTIVPTVGSNTFASAKAEAQGMVNQASLQAVTAKGTLDSMEYNGILKARQLVGLRGAGNAFDGVYYVHQVNHNIQEGDYTQAFELTREGLESKQRILPI